MAYLFYNEASKD